MIQSAVLRDQITKHNITVSDAEVAQLIAAVPPPEVQSAPDFQTNGQFDPTKYQAWLGSAVGQQYVPYLEARYRDQILQAKLLRNVTADVVLSDAALWQRWRDQHETVSIALTPLVSTRVIADSAVRVSDAEVDAYYRDHKSEFDRPEQAFVSYLAVNRALDASDSAAVLQRARDIKAEIQGGAPFAEVARRESIDQVSAQRGGELGTFTKNDMDKQFADAVWSLPLNTVSDPVPTQFGVHVIEVTKRTADSATARHILIPFELAGAHRDLVDAQADSLEQLAASRLDPAVLDTAARALKLPIGQAAPIQKGGQVVIGGTLLEDPGIWAFQAKVGETSPVIEGTDAYYVFRLDSLQQGGVPPLASIRPAVTAAIAEHKKDSLAVQMADELVRRVKGGESLAAASAAMGLQHREFPAFTRIQPPFPNPKLIGTAFGLPVGGLSAPIVTNEGIYVIRVLAHTPADSAEFNKTLGQFQASEVRTARQDRVRYFMAALRAGAKIKDERAEVFKTDAQIEAESPSLPGTSR